GGARPFTAARLEEIRRRQDFVLAELVKLGTVIESCPTSNIRIGGVPAPEAHPIHRFLRSEVNLVIAADDPGIFNSSLADEVAWVVAHTDYDEAGLMARLGDPRRFWFRRD
ncbi:MAG TPA: adenosine deaminase, partial [Anaerolineae bacterium]|nr:adenosine deaminase [Anaerolineae bacterium]